MPDETADDAPEVTLLFDEADEESRKPRRLGEAGTSGFSALGVSTPLLTGLADQMQQLFAAQAIQPSQGFKDAMATWSTVVGQLDRSTLFLGTTPPVSTLVADIAKNLKTLDEQLAGNSMLAPYKALAATSAYNVAGF